MKKILLSIVLLIWCNATLLAQASFDIDTGRLVNPLQGNGQTIINLASIGIRDTSAAFDVTIAATSSTTLTAGRTLTLNMGNVAHTLAFGTTANLTLGKRATRPR